MTWGEVKKIIDDAEGVSDDTEVWYIDISFPDGELDVGLDVELGLTVLA